MVALESGRTSWTGILDAVRFGPEDDATAVTADQLRGVVERLVAAGHWQADDPNVTFRPFLSQLAWRDTLSVLHAP